MITVFPTFVAPKNIYWVLRVKNTIEYSERNERQREEFISEIESLPEGHEFYSIGASGFDNCYLREDGYAPCGEKVIGKASGRHFARTGIVAAKNGRKVVAPFAFNGSVDGGSFEGRLEHALVPALKNSLKSALILGNAPFHRKSWIYDIAEEHGCKVIFFPPYSPDLNPVEKLCAQYYQKGCVCICTISPFCGKLRFTLFTSHDYKYSIKKER